MRIEWTRGLIAQYPTGAGAPVWTWSAARVVDGVALECWLEPETVPLPTFGAETMPIPTFRAETVSIPRFRAETVRC